MLVVPNKKSSEELESMNCDGLDEEKQLEDILWSLELLRFLVVVACFPLKEDSS